jgi:hypothetical protein
MIASNIANIDWELVGKAFEILPTAKKRRVTKYLAEHAAGHFAHENNYADMVIPGPHC